MRTKDEDGNKDNEDNVEDGAGPPREHEEEEKEEEKEQGGQEEASSDLGEGGAADLPDSKKEEFRGWAT